MTDRWVEAVQAYYDLAKGERRNELKGKYASLLDNRGLHPRSIEAGRIQAFQELHPEYANMRFDPVEIRKQAGRDAEDEYVAWIEERLEERLYASSRASADDKPVTGRVVGTAGAPEGTS